MINKKILLYCYEGLGLGIFMFSAGFFDAMIDHPGLPLRQHIHYAIIRRLLIGLSMGITALFIMNATFGKKSGAHINPAVTLAQYRLRRISGCDAIFYILFQFIGGSIGMYGVYLLFPHLISDPAVNYIVTLPGKKGVAIAFMLEFMISFLLITTVLFSNYENAYSGITPYLVAVLLTLYITFEAPFSGMSMNPARTFASAIVAGKWDYYWLYCIAPVMGMLTGQSLFSAIKRRAIEQ